MWLKKVLNKNFSKDAVNYALLEILAEYKRCGIPKSDILKVALTCNPFFLIKELIRRKRAVVKDIDRCIRVADSLCLRQTSGTKEFPVFEK